MSNSFFDPAVIRRTRVELQQTVEPGERPALAEYRERGDWNRTRTGMNESDGDRRSAGNKGRNTGRGIALLPA